MIRIKPGLADLLWRFFHVPVSPRQRAHRFMLAEEYLAREVFERTVVALDQSRRGDMEEVAKHEAALDEAFHGRGAPLLSQLA